MSQAVEIQRAVEILRAGGLVALPTETVYGLGADATNASAIAKIFAAKGRPSTNPLIVHVADAEIAQRYVAVWSEPAQRLAAAFWPGPLTLVLPKAQSIVPAVTAGLSTIAIRCPDHPVAVELLKEFAGPVAAPSANRSNHISPTTAEHVRRELGDKVDLILDGGPCKVGIESTVIDLSSLQPAILRLGAVTQRQLEKIIGPVHLNTTATHATPAISPGQQAVHYAPFAPAFRFVESDLNALQNLLSAQVGKSAVILTIQGTNLAVRERLNSVTMIEMPGSADQYARRLYAALHEADDLHPDMIWVQQPPDEAAWDAVRDRVRRATKPASDAR